MARANQPAAPPASWSRARSASPPLSRAALPLALALLAMLALFVGYQRPQVVTLPADDYHTRLFSGFNRLESNDVRVFRWTNGDATVCVPRTGSASTAFVHVLLLGSAPLRQGIGSVEASLGDGPPARIPLRDGEHWYRLLLRPGSGDGGDSCLRLRSDSFLEGSNPRRLGVPFGALRLELWTPGGVVLPPADLLALVGLLAALAYWLLAGLVRNRWLAALPVALLTLGLLGGVYGRLVLITFDMARMLVIPLSAGLYLGATLLIWRGFQHWALPRYAPHARPLASELLGVALTIGALYGGRELAQYITGHHSFYPLKAGVWPNPTIYLLFPTLVYGAFLAFVLRALRAPEPLPRWTPWLLVFVAAVLPVVLRVPVRGWDSLLYTYRDNQADYIHDVWRVGDDLRGFLGRYVELMPDMRLHNRNHPPGSVVLLWVVERLWGAGPIPATAVTVLLAATAALPIYWLGRDIGGDRVGLLAAATYTVMPGHLIYTTTSMDAVFNTTLAWALWAFWMAMRPDGRPTMALLAGLLLALGLFLTFATLTLGIFGIAVVGYLLAVGYRNWHDYQIGDRRPETRDPRPETRDRETRDTQAHGSLARISRLRVLRQALLVAGGLLGFYGLLYGWSRFNIVDAILSGTRNNFDEVQQDLPPSGLATYVFYILVNVVPYMWYMTFWGTPIMLRQGVASLQRWGHARPSEVLAGAWLVLFIGLALSGLFTREVERIWGFSYPLVAVVLAGYWLEGRQTRWWAAIGLTQCFLLSMFFRTWLNTYW